MDFFKVVSVDNAKDMILDKFRNMKLKIIEEEISKVSGRILAEDIVSNINVPDFNRSTVDGYAIKSSDSHGACETIPSFLKVIGEVMMGEEIKKEINHCEAIYVPTGGMIPYGADSVVMIENVERLDEENIAVYKPVTKNENIIMKGDDITIGQKVLKCGRRLKPHDIGILAAMGISKVKVYCKPRFYIISTGDEIIDLNEDLKKGKIRDINGYTLHSLIEKLGGEVVNKVIVRDDFKMLRNETEKALDLSDIVLISGGSSVGTRDFTYDVINSFEGEGVFIHGISIKPGKPTLVGEAKGKAVFGLPGHPVSSIIVFKVLVQHFINNLLGCLDEINKTKAIIDFNIHSSPGKETYQMVTLDEREDGLYAVPNFGKSGMITLLSKSNGYVVIKSYEEGLNKGEEREVYFL